MVKISLFDFEDALIQNKAPIDDKSCEAHDPLFSDEEADLSSLLGKKSDCPCGREHSCDIQSVVIRNGALAELCTLSADYSNITLVCDQNTYPVCGKTEEKLLADKIGARLIYTSEGFLVPDEAAVLALEKEVSDKTDLIVGVGSGVINDLCKYVSFKHGLPYFIVATAPSMDGYASKGAAMLFGGMKITVNAAVPRAIIADTSVIKDAPLDMLKAGYGDIIGKYSCLNDWRLGVLVTGEPMCDYIYGMTYRTVERIAGMGGAILRRDEKSIAELMRALVSVGIAMAYMGNSRPASGSEHHLSHYFEVVGLLRDEPYLCHGIDVAYSTYVTALLRKKLINIDEPKRRIPTPVCWESEIKRVYAGGDGSTADGIIALQKKLGWIYNDRFPLYAEKWDEVRDILKDSPSPEKICTMLESVGLPLSRFDQTYSRTKLDDAIAYAKDLKDRYTVLWLYGDVTVENN